MKKPFNLLIILSAIFSVWGIADIYNYVTIGKEVLLYYESIDAISQLVNYNLAEGIVKIVFGLCLLLIVLITKRTRK